MNGSKEGKEVIIDFTTNNFESVTLFTGRKNGKRARSSFPIDNADYFKFISNNDQVITSSYFLGLIGERLNAIYSTVGSISEIINRVNLTELNEVSRNECMRAIKRGIASGEVFL